MTTKKPNILLIMTDQHRWDRLSCTGGERPTVQTPNLDTIAQEGVRFDNCYAASPVCAPCRAAIMSGMFPPGCGVVNNWVEFVPGTELMTDRLAAQGYQNALVGKLHFVPAIEPFGFHWKQLHDAPYSVYGHDDRYSEYIKWLRSVWPADRADPVTLFDEDELAFQDDNWGQFIMGSNFCTEEQHSTAWVTEQALRFLEERDEEKPFFLKVSYFGPHQPMDVPQPWNTMYDMEEIDLPEQFDADMSDCPVFQATCAQNAAHYKELFSPADYRRILASYFGQISMIDTYVGRLLQRLRDDGLWDDTLIVFTSDHGDHNGAYGLWFKGQMYDSCAKVALLVKPPAGEGDGEPQGAVRDQVVNVMDLYGTLLDAAGDAEWQQPHIEARSLQPLLADEEERQAPRPWLNETHSIIGPQPDASLAMLRRDNLKLVRKATGPGADDALYEMFDMDDAVPEVRNVFDDPAYAAARDALCADLDAWHLEQMGKYPAKIVSHRRTDLD